MEGLITKKVRAGGGASRIRSPGIGAHASQSNQLFSYALGKELTPGRMGALDATSTRLSANSFELCNGKTLTITKSGKTSYDSRHLIVQMYGDLGNKLVFASSIRQQRPLLTVSSGPACKTDAEPDPSSPVPDRTRPSRDTRGQRSRQICQEHSGTVPGRLVRPERRTSHGVYPDGEPPGHAPEQAMLASIPSDTD